MHLLIKQTQRYMLLISVLCGLIDIIRSDVAQKALLLKSLVTPSAVWAGTLFSHLESFAFKAAKLICVLASIWHTLCSGQNI